MNTICPGCERPTYWRQRAYSETGKYRPALPEGFLAAVTEDGTCVTCWRARNNKSRAEAVSPQLAGVEHRPPMTEEDAERARQALARLAEDRRRRGVPVDGLDPLTLRRPGLSLVEV